MANLTDLNPLEEWYKAVIGAGAVIAVPAVTVGNQAALVCALGLILFGTGEFINHPFRSRIEQDGAGTVWKISGRSRHPKPFGYLLDGVGIALFAWGVFLVIASDQLNAQTVG